MDKEVGDEKMEKIKIESQSMQSINTSVLKEYYAKYLTEVRGLKPASVKHYFDALNNISKRLKSKNLVNYDIYEIGDLERLGDVRKILFADPEFIEQNERGNRMYSVGLNNYYRFASGEEFRKIKDKIWLMDMPVAAEDAIKVEIDVWKRSGIMRTQAIELAGYACEINEKHDTFIAEKNHKYAIYNVYGEQIRKFRYRCFVPREERYLYDYFEWL